MVTVIFDWDGTIVDRISVSLEPFLSISKRYFKIDVVTAKETFLDNSGLLEEIFSELAEIDDRNMLKKEIYDRFQELEKLLKLGDGL